MKLEALEIKDYPPIKSLKIDDLGSMVVIAGANGSGKSRLKDAIVQGLQGNPVLGFKIAATRKPEIEKFGANFIEVQQGQPNNVLINYMNGHQSGRGAYVGSLVQIDSDRSVRTTKYNPISWRVADPDDEITPITMYYPSFSDQWQGFIDYIHTAVAAYDTKIRKAAEQNPNEKSSTLFEKHPRPFEKYKAIFKKILPDKELQDIDPTSPREFTYKDINGELLSFSTLSSGEQEVVKILFNVARKDIKHSIIIVDEPELHLHPTLAFQLIENLKEIGNDNQYIFLTHSADLISTYYSTGDVYFIDSKQTSANQAHRLIDLNESHREVTRLMSNNLGLFAVGKKLVFVEGKDASIDRHIYHKIAQKCMPEAKIIPVGSVENISTLHSLDKQIANSIFGVDLYMIRDRDGLLQEQVDSLESGGKIKCLSRRHVENYLLDPEVLAMVAKHLRINEEDKTPTAEYLENKIQEIAGQTLQFTLLQNIKRHLGLHHNLKIAIGKWENESFEYMRKKIVDSVTASVRNLSQDYSATNLERQIQQENTTLQAALKNGDWLKIFHGKKIFQQICGDVLKERNERVRRVYVEIALKDKPAVFEDINEIFRSFT